MTQTALPGIKLFNLKGKCALITGGSKGLGLAMAAGLASAGADVALLNRNLEEGRTAADQLQKDYGVKAMAYAANVTDLAEVEAVVASVVKTFGHVDILINSAGINIRGAIDELKPEEFQQVMEVNVTGTWNTSRAVTPYMKKQGSGRIINMASTLGLVGPGQ